MTKFLYTASVAVLVIYGYAAFAQEAPTPQAKAPSANAICGFQWRQAKAADPTLKGRDAWFQFRREHCGGTAAAKRKSTDDAIKQFLDGQKTEADPFEERALIQFAGRKGGRKA